MPRRTREKGEGEPSNVTPASRSCHSTGGRLSPGPPHLGGGGPARVAPCEPSETVYASARSGRPETLVGLALGRRPRGASSLTRGPEKEPVGEDEEGPRH